MWKIGPECAAQQAKCASASVMNCGVRSACATVHCHVRRVGSICGRRAVRCGAGRTRNEAGIKKRQRDDADHQHRRAPVIGRDQPARERRDRQRRHAHAGRHQRHREAAVVFDPGARRRHHRRIETAGRNADQDAERQLELPQAGAPGSPRSARRRAAACLRVRRCGCRYRSDSAPQKNAASPMARKSIVAAADTPLRDQPIVLRNRLQEHRQRQHRAERRRRSSARRRRPRPSRRKIRRTCSCVSSALFVFYDLSE